MPEARERQVIRGRNVEPDAWKTVGVDPAEDLASLPAGPIIVPLKVLVARPGELLDRDGPLGVWLAPDDDPADLASRFSLLGARLALVAVHFPKFADGRGFSTAVLLRTRYGYRGELRAFGDIGRDQLFDLARCGFDAFALPPQHDAHEALAAFGDFTLRYQGSVDDPVPLFRKRATAGGIQ